MVPLTHHLPKLQTHFFLPFKPKTPTFLQSPKPPFLYPPIFSLFSSLSPTLPPKTPKLIRNLENTLLTQEQEEQPHVEISIEKLFIPPETELKTNESFSSRILKGSNIVLSKYANNAQVIKADFIKSSVDTESCPNDGSPEFALVGRSHVGKSSLLNSIVRRKKLALTSKKPGKTQCINHFWINDSWYLVDLPGYGYAQAPGEVRVEWGKFCWSWCPPQFV